MTWSSGDRVRVRGADWRVIRTASFSDCEALDLAAEHTATTRTILLPFDRPRSPSPPGYQVVSRRRWARLVGTLLRSTSPYGGLQYCPPAIQLLPYQLEPALAMLRHGELRILVADDVGLGKTVEAGLIANEVARRNPQSRTLILCPAAIRDQWVQELSTLFALDVIRADSGWLRRAARELPHDVNPWSLPGIYLASADFIKRPEALHPLEHVRWDLLVVDEAHAATPATHRRTAIEAVARRSYRLVLLTATPHSGDDEQFAALCALGAAGGAAVVLFRRSRADTPLESQKARSTMLPVRLTDAERRCHRLLEAYTERLWTESADRADSRARLVAILLRKRALSSLHSLLLSVRRRLELIDRPLPAPSQLHLPLDEDPMDEDAATDDVVGADGLRNTADERMLLETLADAAAAVTHESKVGVLLRLLRRASQPAIVFTEYRDTAARLAAALMTAGHDTCVLHGGLSSHERAAVISTFTTRGCLLVATDAASEGLNLQRTCRLVIHFELPWAPLRLHQRRGRIDRIGQSRRVHEIALVANDTSEHLVLRPLLHRSQRAMTMTGTPIAGHLSESRVAAHVLGGHPVADATTSARCVPPIRSLDLRAEGRLEASRLALLRRAAGGQHSSSASTRGGIVPITTGRGRRNSGDLTLVVIVTVRDRTGTTVERLPLVISLHTMIRHWHRRQAPLRNQVQQIVAGARAAVTSIVQRHARDRLLEVAPMYGAASSSLHRRVDYMRLEVRSAARELVQAGLFDRRAMRAAGGRERMREMLMEDLIADATAAGVEASSALDARYEIAAALAGGGL